MGRIRLVTEVPGPRSRALVARRDAAGARGAAHLTDLAVVRAHGPVVTDADGNQLLDFAGGIGALALGHTPAAVVEALRRQAGDLVHVSAIVATYEPYVETLERLVRLFPGGGPAKAVLLNSGAEAVETAVKIARSATGRAGVLVFEGAYHGRTNLTLAMTSKYAAFKRGFGPFAPEIYRAPFPDLASGPRGTSEEASVDEAVARLDHALVAHVDPEALAAVVIEPVLGEGGFVPVPARFMRALRERCDRHGVVLVADEVQSGMGRTGTVWAIERTGVVPDLLVTAKSLAAGMPLAAVVGRPELVDAPHPGGLGGTYSGNPLACAAAVAVLDAIASDAFLERARAIGERMLARLESIAATSPAVRDVRGVGPMRALEFVRPGRDGAPEPDPDAVQRVGREALRRGLIVIRAGLYANLLRLLPPLDLSDEELDEGLDVLEEAIEAASAGPVTA